MTAEDYQDGKLITLSKALDSRAKGLNVFYFLVFLTIATFAIRGCLYNSLSTPVIIIMLVFAAAFYIMSYRFINKALMSEKLFVNKTQIQIIKRGFFNRNVQHFNVANISNLRHLDKPVLSNHPLAGETFDYLGFQTGQKVINEMHGDNRIGFRYKGREITFGENIYSWDFEELEVLLYDSTGIDFHHKDSFEVS